MPTCVLWLVVILCSVTYDVEASSLSVEQIQKLEELIRNVVQCRNVPGMAVALVRRNETVYTGGFGIRETNSSDAVTDKTLFNLASQSKAFTSTVAADAVARGKITWDAPLREVLGPNFRLQDEFRSEEASLRDLLSHRLGMPSYWGITTSVMNLTRLQILERLKDFPVLYDFRDRYLYSNYLYVAAAAVVETASCETWEDAVQNRIFKPLGMTASRLSTRLTDGDWDNIAYSADIVQHNKVEQFDEPALLPIVQELAPAAGVYSNAQDMAKWLRFHLNSGKSEQGHQVVDADAMRDTYHPNTAEYSPDLTRDTFPVDDLIYSYAMGWRNGVYRGYRKNLHMAAYNGYQGTLTFLPDVGVGVWAHLSGAANNRGYDARNTVTMYSLDLLLGNEIWLNSSTACSFPAPWYQDDAAPPAPAVPEYARPSVYINTTEYIGKYYHPAFGTLEIFDDDNDDHLLGYRYGELMVGYLKAKGGNREDFTQFMTGPLGIIHVYDDPDGFNVNFNRGDSGAIESVQFHYFEFSKPPVFTIVEVKPGNNTVASACAAPPSPPPSTAGPTSGLSHFRSSKGIVSFFYVNFLLCLKLVV
ncbi:uncharacterized protein [Haliotis cracherodii]|uniref:uncharacterized protein n=1 Tax=Haliotis cracherodii TaxID=6455 RepID=UPI0039E747D3